LLGDWPLYETCKAYGIYNEETHRAARRTFVLDMTGTVRAIIDERDAAKLHKT
jgi:alkyl hydroperoxide reductase subunit AhpC